MWLILAFVSAALLGCYDSLKKQALRGNAVIPVLFLNTLFSSLIFLPFIVLSGTTYARRHHLPHGKWWLGYAQVYPVEGLHRLVELDPGLFRHEASALDDCRPYQCHPSGDGAGGCHAGVRRAPERLAVARCAARCGIVPDAEPLWQERGHRLQARQLDLYDRWCLLLRGGQWSLR